MGSKSKNRDRDSDRSPSRKKKHKRHGSRSPERSDEERKRRRKSKKSRHRHREDSTTDDRQDNASPSAADDGATDFFLAKSPERSTEKTREDRDGVDRANRSYHERNDRRTTDFSPLGAEEEEEDQAVVVRREKSPLADKSRGSEDGVGGAAEATSLSIEETNRIRAKLGLKPLETGPKKTDEAQSGGLQEDIHVPAENIGKKKEQEKIKEKLSLIKEKRKANQKLHKIKGLAESDSEDDISNWIKKSRTVEREKKLAADRAKMLDEMDDEFGVGRIVEEEKQKTGGSLMGKNYTSSDLTGLKVEHDQAEFSEEKSIILTLKDAPILGNEEGDVLTNVNIAEDERTKKNLQNKKAGAGGYKAYDDDEVDEFGQFKPKQLLGKYNEEIEGEKRESFQLGRGGSYDASYEARMAEMRRQISSQAQSLAGVAPILATEYLSKEEMTFKKKKRRVKKVRARGSGVLTADDLTALGGEVGDSGKKDLGNRRRGREEAEPAEGKKIDEGGDDMDIDPDDLGGWTTIEGPEVNLDGQAVDFDEDTKDFERALTKARRLKKTTSKRDGDVKPVDSKVAEKLRATESLKAAIDRKREVSAESGEGASGEIVRQKGEVLFNATSEFCRVLGELPTYGQSGNRDSDEEDLMDFEREETEPKTEDGTMTGVSTVYGGRGLGTWNEVDDDDEDDDETSGAKNAADEREMAFMDEEPSADKGISGALHLAMKKGYVVKEENKKAAMTGNRLREDLSSQNYSIEDKNMRDIDDKYSNRREDRYSGPTSKFNEKEGYKPDVKLEYVDDYGNPMNAKEAFRFLSHRFHGKGSGKMKTEKRVKKLLEMESIKKMASGDTPLGTMKKLVEKQRRSGAAYVTLSGGKSQAGDLKK